jgi:hypothetical protein
MTSYYVATLARYVLVEAIFPLGDNVAHEASSRRRGHVGRPLRRDRRN